jgi:cytochrome c oxidase subunit 4
MQDLLVLSHEDYTQLRHELKEAGLDVCYTAQSARPIRRRWSPERLQDAALQQQIARRRPADASYRLASVQCTRPGNWLWPDQLTVTFHAVSPSHDAALQRYLDTHRAPHQPSEVTAPAAGEHTAATTATYVQVALILALITAFEVAILYVPNSFRPPRWALLLVLMLLSALKFGIVVSFFMHLRYDHRLYAGFFIGGLVVAVGTILALLTLFREPAPRPDTAAIVPTPVAAVQPSANDVTVTGDAAAGQLVFQQTGCGSCHKVSGVTGAVGSIGPLLDGLFSRAANRLPGVSATDYIRQSIEAPEVYVVSGYLKLMPALRQQMSQQEFADLLAFLHTL